jgi:hypothetical protein
MSRLYKITLSYQYREGVVFRGRVWRESNPGRVILRVKINLEGVIVESLLIG